MQSFQSGVRCLRERLVQVAKKVQGPLCGEERVDSDGG